MGTRLKSRTDAVVSCCCSASSVSVQGKAGHMRTAFSQFTPPTVRLCQRRSYREACRRPGRPSTKRPGYSPCGGSRARRCRRESSSPHLSR